MLLLDRYASRKLWMLIMVLDFLPCTVTVSDGIPAWQSTCVP